VQSKPALDCPLMPDGRTSCTYNYWIPSPFWLKK
jgi:hypothetical protein